jgi:hypothetical protein
MTAAIGRVVRVIRPFNAQLHDRSESAVMGGVVEVLRVLLSVDFPIERGLGRAEALREPGDSLDPAGSVDHCELCGRAAAIQDEDVHACQRMYVRNMNNAIACAESAAITRRDAEALSWSGAPQARNPHQHLQPSV